jgi:hypothetical protein
VPPAVLDFCGVWWAVRPEQELAHCLQWPGSVAFSLGLQPAGGLGKGMCSSGNTLAKLMRHWSESDCWLPAIQDLPACQPHVNPDA